MNQLSAPLVDKLDDPLAQLCNGGLGISPAQRVPIIVRYADGGYEDVIDAIRRLGGTPRHHLKIISCVAAWLPIASVEGLAARPSVAAIELEREFTTA